MDITIQPGCESWHAGGSGENGDTFVVLVHGFSGNPRATRPLAERLNGEGFGVHAVRLPGHGTTVKDFSTSRYDDYRRTVDQALTAARSEADRVVLLGHSMGGTLVLDVASSRPDDVAGVVAINPQIHDPEQFMAKLAPLLKHIIPVVPRNVAELPSNDIAMPGVEEGAYPHVSAKAAHSLIKEIPRVRDQLSRLTAPLLLVTSPQDHTVPAANSDTVAELVGGDVTRVYAERSYHVPQIDWDREAVEQAVVDFVAARRGA